MESGGVLAALVDDIVAERFDAVARFFQDIGATLRGMSWMPTAPALPAEELRFLLRYWHRLRPTSRLPLETQITPFDLRPTLGFVVLVDTVEDGWDGRYRLYGSKIAERSGTDMTGRLVSEFDGGSNLAVFTRALPRAVHLRREPAFAAYSPPVTVSATSWNCLVLPFTDPTETVTRLLVGMYPEF